MEQKCRYHVIDFLRGIALIGMVIFHGLMNLVYTFDCEIEWFYDIEWLFYGYGGCIFIVLSGFCWNMGKRNFKRGVMMLLFSALISFVTIFFMPDYSIRFGVICLMGTACLVMIPMDKVLKKINPYVGVIVSTALFIFTKNADRGYIGLENWEIHIPNSWFVNDFTAFLGFPKSDFWSMDYFPVVPWIFIFIAGYFLYGIFKKHNLLKYLEPSIFRPVQWVGRHSLIIYLAHQPVLFVVCGLYFAIF